MPDAIDIEELERLLAEADGVIGSEAWHEAMGRLTVLRLVLARRVVADAAVKREALAALEALPCYWAVPCGEREKMREEPPDPCTRCTALAKLQMREATK